MGVTGDTKAARFAPIVCDFAGGLHQLGPEWQVLPGLAGATSVIAGNLIGIAQTSLRRLTGAAGRRATRTSRRLRRPATSRQ
jgi:NADH:ubiquinone oxidoreductase subunit 2 (subunit N)